MVGYKQSLKSKRTKEKNSKKEKKREQILGNGMLNQITPNKGYFFFSNYFKIDDAYATILTVFNTDGSDDNLPPMWGINLIPRFVGNNVTTRLLTSIKRADQKWVEKNQSKADTLADQENAEVQRSNKRKEHVISGKKQRDLQQIAMDLTEGDSYLYVAFKILVKAPVLDELDEAVERIKREYDVHFGSMYLTAFEGQQKEDVMNIFQGADKQLGKNYMFTSTEFSGAYNLVTHGIEDPDGEYVGQMRADVNNAAVLWNVDHFDSHVVFAASSKAETMSQKDFKNQLSSTLWGTKLSQASLLNNRRVIHLVLNGANIEDMGVDLSDITTTVSLNSGDINPFELFGDVKNELSIFPMHVNKLRLMVQQLNPELEPFILDRLSEEIRKFYVDNGMWTSNAQENREFLRIVGIPHEQVPRLRNFVPYLDTSYVGYTSQDAQDPNITKGLLLLKGLFYNMLEENGDLFDTFTSDVIDNAYTSPRVIYDFSSLMLRGKGVAMAQFVNALGYATSSLQKGDLLVIHGADQLDENVLEYTKNTLDALQKKDVRIAYLYDSVEKMLKDTELNDLARADWTLTGYMANVTIEKYKEKIGSLMPDALSKAISVKDNKLFYLRRGFDNIVFEADLILN